MTDDKNSYYNLLLQTSEKLKKKIHRLPGVFDCLSLYEIGYAEDGVHVIQPKEGVDIEVWYDMYSTFKVNDETDKYRLTVGGFYGNCFDCVNAHNGVRFTTFDNDNDLRGADNCAVMFHVAW
jgi:hypothetical protein